MNIVRMICLLIFGSEGNAVITEGTIIYFVISAFLLIGFMFTHKKFNNSEYFKCYMDKNEKNKMNV